MSENIKIVSATIECWRCAGPCAPEHCPNCGNRKIVNGTRIIEEALRKLTTNATAKLIATAKAGHRALEGALSVIQHNGGYGQEYHHWRNVADALAAALADHDRQPNERM